MDCPGSSPMYAYAARAASLFTGSAKEPRSGMTPSIGIACSGLVPHVGDNRPRLEQFVKSRELGSQKSLAEFLKENEILHSMLVEFADNQQLSVLIEQMRLQLFPKRVSNGAAEETYRLASAREHLRIAEAVLKGDAEGAQAAMKEHLRNAQERLLAFIP
jgi:hypothetical protein